MTATQPTITNIADRAMLVNVSIRQFNPVKTDKKVTQEVATQHGSEVSMGRYAKSVVAKESLDTLRKLAGEIRQEHYRRTLPWAEDGARILTSAGYFAYAEYMRDAQAKWDPAVSEFLNSWDRYVSEARAKLGTLYDPSDYPSVRELRGKFEFRYAVRPVPTASDFRVSLGSEEVSAIRAEIQSTLDASVHNAMRDVWGRMRDVVGKMAERLRAYDPNNASAAPFRDSLVSNITELLEVVPSLNLTGDAAVTDFAARIRQDLTGFDAQALRDNMFTREDVAQRAESIYNQMAAFIS
jgi:hypothetical protein